MRLLKSDNTHENLEVAMKVMAAMHMDASSRGEDTAEVAYGFNYAGRENRWIKITIEPTSQAEAEAIFKKFKERMTE